VQEPRRIEGAGTRVRPLKVPGLPADFAARHGGRGEVRVAAGRKELVARYGRAVADALEGLVDRSRETLVFVGWTTAGPPDGELIYGIQRTVKGTTVEFRVKAPRGAAIRGMRARLGADWFAVPRGWKATFDPNERP